MKFAVVGRERSLERDVAGAAKRMGKIVEHGRPDTVISCGGEGTFLFAEMKYPNAPKLLLRYRQPYLTKKAKAKLEKVLGALARGQFKIKNETKVEASVWGKKAKKVVALNEINIHYEPPRAMRLRIFLNNKRLYDFVGDGLIVATPYGSSAYFYSIAHKIFSDGLGIAFNNPTKKMSAIVVPKSSKIRVDVLRIKGVLAYDCSPRLIRLQEGDKIEIKAAKGPARIIKISGWPLKIDL